MIVVTGATGSTGQRAAEALLAKGERVRVIGRDANKLAPLAKLGAEPFMTSYTMSEGDGHEGRFLRRLPEVLFGRALRTCARDSRTSAV